MSVHTTSCLTRLLLPMLPYCFAIVCAFPVLVLCGVVRTVLNFRSGTCRSRRISVLLTMPLLRPTLAAMGLVTCVLSSSLFSAWPISTPSSSKPSVRSRFICSTRNVLASFVNKLCYSHSFAIHARCCLSTPCSLVAFSAWFLSTWSNAFFKSIRAAVPLFCFCLHERRTDNVTDSGVRCCDVVVGVCECAPLC